MNQETEIIFRSRGRPPCRVNPKVVCAVLEEDTIKKADAESTRLGISRSEFITSVLDWYFKTETERLTKLKELERKIKVLEKDIMVLKKKNESLKKRLNTLLGEETPRQHPVTLRDMQHPL